MRTINKSDGIVSLVSTIILGLLLLIIVTGLAVVMIGVQRQATDDDQSTRAYYAAESGVEDALLKIKSVIAANPATAVTTLAALPQSCQTGNVGANTSYVCQTITMQSGAIKDSAPQDYANQYEVNQNAGDGAGLDYIDLYWNENGKDNLSPTSLSLPSSTYPSGANWTYPAIMELTDSAFQSSDKTLTGTIGASIPPLTQIAEPRSGAVPNQQFGASNIPSIWGVCQAGPRDASHPYNCYAQFTGFKTLPGMPAGGANHIIRIRPRYATAGYQIEFRDGHSQLISSVTDSKATVDVTAKSGDIVRRVQAKVQIKSTTDTGLDYVLFADTNICKNFQINTSSETAPSNSTCN